jgi:hypothetical protein
VKAPVQFLSLQRHQFQYLFQHLSCSLDELGNPLSWTPHANPTIPAILILPERERNVSGGWAVVGRKYSLGC